MKKIAITGLVLVPLMAGCSNSTLGPRLAPEAKEAHGVSSLQAQMRKLQRRVRALNRRVKARGNRSPYAAGAPSRDLASIKARLARLEAAPRSGGSGASGPDLERTVADLAAQVAALSRRLEAQGSGQAQPSAAMTRILAEVKERLADLEAVSRAADTSGSVADLKRTVAGLTVRLAELSRAVEAQADRQPEAPRAISRDIEQLKSRLAELAAAQRATASSTSDADLKRTVANLSGRLERLSRTVETAANRPPQVPQAINRDVGELKTRLGQLEAAGKSAASSDSVADLKRTIAGLAAQVGKLTSQAAQGASTASPKDEAALRKVTESLTRLEQAQTKSANELGQLQSDLEKDRTLVIDYLEDLDNRLSAFEKNAPAAKPPATSPPKQ